VRNVIELIEEIRDDRYGKEQLLIRRKLLGTEFKQLWGFIEDDEDLHDWVRDKLRLAHTLSQ
jgi:hypothetical protein